MFSPVDVEIRPEPGPAERQAILAGLAELLAGEEVAAAYRSLWRAEGIRENVEQLADNEGSLYTSRKP
jgi:hypothetical protein